MDVPIELISFHIQTEGRSGVFLGKFFGVLPLRLSRRDGVGAIAVEQQVRF